VGNAFLSAAVLKVLVEAIADDERGDERVASQPVDQFFAIGRLRHDQLRVAVN
jgi:hypothetical protein